jgi:hypothetical protein
MESPAFRTNLKEGFTESIIYPRITNKMEVNMKSSKGFSLRLFLVLVSLVMAVSLLVSTAVLAQTPGTSPSASPSLTPTPTASASAAASPTQTSTPSISRMIFGQAASIAADKTSVVIQKSDQSTVTVKVDSNTRYSLYTLNSALSSVLGNYMPNMMESWDFPDNFNSPDMSDSPGMGDGDGMHGGMGGMDGMTQRGSFSNIAVGDLLVVRGLTASNVARQIVIVKFQDNIKYIQGNVTAVAANSLTVAPFQGSSVTIGWNSQSKVFINGAISIQVGQRIAAIYDSSANFFKFVMAEAAAAAGASASPSTSPTP